MLTKRQRIIADAIPLCDTLADVGCDHGKIGLEILLCKKAQHVYFIDISAPSLQKAMNLCKKSGIESDKTTFLCQNGLGEIKAQCAVVAGMGGSEILEIINAAKHLPDILILQPMKNPEKIRKGLVNRYNFIIDRLFYDKKYYNLMYLERGKDNLSDLEIIFGRTNLIDMHDDFIKYLRGELNVLDSALENIAGDDEDLVRRKRIIESLLKKRREKT